MIRVSASCKELDLWCSLVATVRIKLKLYLIDSTVKVYLLILDGVV